MLQATYCMTKTKGRTKIWDDDDCFANLYFLTCDILIDKIRDFFWTYQTIMT